jgi:hypothetical protein
LRSFFPSLVTCMLRTIPLVDTISPSSWHLLRILWIVDEDEIFRTTATSRIDGGYPFFAEKSNTNLSISFCLSTDF